MPSIPFFMNEAEGEVNQLSCSSVMVVPRVRDRIKSSPSDKNEHVNTHFVRIPTFIFSCYLYLLILYYIFRSLFARG